MGWRDDETLTEDEVEAYEWADSQYLDQLVDQERGT